MGMDYHKIEQGLLNLRISSTTVVVRARVGGGGGGGGRGGGGGGRRFNFLASPREPK